MPEHSAGKGVTLWFTGLSGAGKTTISRIVAETLKRQGRRVEILDGDEIRQHLSKGLGFTKEDRDTNVKRIAYVAGLLTRNGVIAITAAISPYREARQWAREWIGDFIEVYVRCPVEVCAARDVKGLYRQAFAGEIPRFTGVSDPYEAPLEPEIIVDTHRETPNESAMKVIQGLKAHGVLPADESPLTVQLDTPASADEGKRPMP